jgi:hypothetical protein
MATALVGKQRFEKLISSGAPGFSARATSLNTSTGRCRYWIATQISAASKLSSSRDRVGSSFRSWTNQRSSRGLAASSSSFIPWPITSS